MQLRNIKNIHQLDSMKVNNLCLSEDINKEIIVKTCDIIFTKYVAQ